jgi:hypothetical protein
MNTLDVDLEEVVRRLSVNANIENGFVNTIGKTGIVIHKNKGTETEYREYEKLVTTIPAPFFWKAYGDSTKEFKCLPITNIITDAKPPMFDDKFEMVYYSEEFPFTRVSHLNGKYALEFTGVMTKEQFSEIFGEFPILDYFVVKQGRIFNRNDNRPPQDNIKFLGRFAEWNYQITTEHIIKKSIEYHEKTN